MNPHRCILHLLISLVLFFFTNNVVTAQKRKQPPGGKPAVVVDERLSALRASPELNGKLLRRLGRGRLVAVRAIKTSQRGIVFYLVKISSRTRGWIQREAVASPWRQGDDQRLFALIKSSSDFDLIVRARIFLDHFPRSPLRPAVMLILGDAAEEISNKLTKDAARRIPAAAAELKESFFLNCSGLDRYNRQGVTFVFTENGSRLHYDGAAWKEIIRRFPRSPEAGDARKKLWLLANNF
jgi:hypothetical protein